MAKLLVVDDDESTREILTALFESGGHEVRAAVDGQGALAMLDAEPGIELVLSDVHMVGMDGLTLLESIRERHPATPVVLMSAYASVDTAIAAIKAGAHDFLTKPLCLEDLRRVMDRALGPLGPRAAGRERGTRSMR